MVWDHFERWAPEIARDQHGLRHPVALAKMKRALRLTQNQIDWPRVPLRLHEPAHNFQTLRGPIQCAQKQRLDIRRCPPDIWQRKLEQVLLVFTVEEADAGFQNA